ncbi:MULTISPECIES: M20 aminoacylase family protein [Brenneria]|uniref:Amidohydrolase n=1 Tax=Brenneria nigrifluens DSM 30175 = ATCC 13028 TaxID=1121120 RepID=A0A2U1UVR3_9GAMM|nr:MULTISPECIES: M20 aminoacylase family protein [Brenneria]EHD22875.1 amidohydrolase [Brenneria sp. EniD312]PWC25776.1 amidohydrolase [Brenneria nigrifluens] [Brenneria nigrifluens DSM 30175 = ATCC 13028]QCR05842.1 amidohydrolase [Brenneria nigrifluens] [Brenneria nigrifluens DSM 30175 = ATCC 13028]
MTDSTLPLVDQEEMESAVRRFLPELIAIRHHIHQHPEIGFEEFATAQLVAEKLTAWGLSVATGIGGTGVVATLRGRYPGSGSIGLRADMDALYISEKTGLPYASVHAGKMHACGHDGHTAMLLGAARYLAQHPDFAGTVHFIFQPAEEGLGGAPAMLNDGLLTRFPCDRLFGLHNKPGVAAGRFSIRSGPMLAASDVWQVTFHGTGGHGGSGAHLSIDPTLPAAQFMLGLQTIISRNVPAMEAAVLSIGHIQGGDINAPNVIPDRVRLKGTGRSYSPAIRQLLETRLRELAHHAAQGFGATAEVSYQHQYPPLINDARVTELAIAAAAQVVGAEQVDTAMTPLLGAEDFSYMLEQRPGAFMMLGNSGEDDAEVRHLHTPHYDFNDALIPLGIRYWATLVYQELRPA